MTSSNHEELAKVLAAPPSSPEDRDYQQLWFALARRPWKSLVLVPTHPDGSADQAARTLAEVGQRVSGLPVRAVTMSTLDYGTALALADLQERIRSLTTELSQAPEAIEVTPGDVDAVSPNWAWARHPGDPAQGEATIPKAIAQFVIAIPSLISEPLGLSVTQAADAVVVIVEVGRTRMADVQRVVDQVGRERVAGCILVK